MITTYNPETYQLQLLDDAATDAARHERQEWQRAIDQNLHALRDYVSPAQLIIWQPGDGRQGKAKSLDVQVVTTTACTCQRYRLIGRCPHVAFAQRLDATRHPITTDTPVAAMEVSS